MTRSTLLHLLSHPAALTGADVHELEQLAQAFPYCQTAHLLLAKAAHDQSSMLAGQRLRRAATYAADRALLRQLIELPAPAEPVLVESVATEAQALAVAAVGGPPAAAVVPDAVAPPAEPAAEAALFEVEHTQLPLAELASAEPSQPAATQLLDAPLADSDQAEIPPVAETTASALTETVAEAALEDELPAQAPPIRPPAEAEAARHEFGLMAAEPADIVAYQLPELLEIKEALTSGTPTVTLAQVALPVFAGVADVGYAPGEGSRLGFCLQSPLAEAYSLTTGPAALLPSAPLPPTGEFFAPDALLLAHLEAQQLLVSPPPPLVATDLINSFLRRGAQGPPRRRPAPPLPDAEDEEQPDLSGPSTRAVPDLASENLAKILARQGKPDRAIAIYERLMVKHPEKIAYFTAQIDSLRPSSQDN